MAAKRKAPKPKQDDLAKPSKWRLQHGGFSGPIREADPETGSPVQHRRAVDTLGQGILVGTLGTLAMHFGLTTRARPRGSPDHAVTIHPLAAPKSLRV